MPAPLTKTRGDRCQRGMTLIEVMIALFVFSLIAAASIYTLRLGVDARDQLHEADDRLKNLQIARVLIKEDLAQASVRLTRDEFGVAAIAPFLGGARVFSARRQNDERILMTFTRAGWLNPEASAPRSTLQHVEYVLRGDEIIRRARFFLDDVTGAPRIERVVFEGVEDVSVEFFNGEFRGDLNWASEWPLLGAQTPLPRAVAMTVRWSEDDSLRQLFWIGEAAP
ncbi:MAG: type II secretion system minor pseudopilin GspJ [Pseudomonadota bacterium]